jgi:hypothetical protein
MDKPEELDVKSKASLFGERATFKKVADATSPRLVKQDSLDRNNNLSSPARKPSTPSGNTPSPAKQNSGSLQQKNSNNTSSETNNNSPSSPTITKTTVTVPRSEPVVVYQIIPFILLIICIFSLLEFPSQRKKAETKTT